MPTKNIIVIDDKERIENFLEGKSESMRDVIIENPHSKYLLIHKYLTHSDLITSGKRTGNQGVEKNYLYYLSIDEMNEIEQIQNKKFESAKQSNISVPEEFWKALGLKSIERREGKQKEEHEHPILNSYAKIYLVNDTLKYFDINYTKRVFEKLNKDVDWNFDNYKIELSNEKFTEIQLSQAVHGIGTQEDEMFHKLRRSLFRNDVIMFLFKEDKNGEKTLYIMLEKNPRFFSILGETNSTWEAYLSQKSKVELRRLNIADELNNKMIEEKTRKQQSKWRNMLAEEMMNYTTVDGEVFCPLTYITADFYNIGPLFVASHIKEYSKSDTKEAYDINNGLLLCANADALFDKHLITISENKEIIFSFVLENNYVLKNQLRLDNQIFKSILNEERMKYIEFHRKRFEEEEEKRKKNPHYEYVMTEKDDAWRVL